MRKSTFLVFLLVCLFCTALATGGLAQDNNKCKPNFAVVYTPSFVIDGVDDEAVAELWPTDDNKIPVMTGKPRGRLKMEFVGPLLGPDQLNKNLPMGILHWTCLEKIDDERSALYTWTIAPKVLITKIDKVTLTSIGRDTLVDLTAQNGQLMARLRLLTANGKFLDQRFVSPAFGQQQVVNIGEEFGVEDWGYRLEVITPVGYPAKLRVRVEQQRRPTLSIIQPAR